MVGIGVSCWCVCVIIILLLYIILLYIYYYIISYTIIIYYTYYYYYILYIYYLILYSSLPLIFFQSLLFFLFCSLLFLSSSSSSYPPNIHSILVGSYIYLFIFFQYSSHPIPNHRILNHHIFLPNPLIHLLFSPSSSIPVFPLPIFILYLSGVTDTYLYSSQYSQTSYLSIFRLRNTSISG